MNRCFVIASAGDIRRRRAAVAQYVNGKPRNWEFEASHYFASYWFCYMAVISTSGSTKLGRTSLIPTLVAKVKNINYRSTGYLTYAWE